MKKCSKCGEVKLVSEFYKDKGKKDGLNGWCKKCSKEASRKYRNANPKKTKAASKKWQEKNSEKTKAASKKWQEKNSEKIKARRKKYEAKIETYFKRTAHKLWKDSSRWIELKTLLKSQNHKCALSDEVLTRQNISLDHIKAKANDGNNDISNLQFVTKDINYAKRALLEEEFIAMCWKVVDNFKAKYNAS